jgi:hypothetical protein
MHLYLVIIRFVANRYTYSAQKSTRITQLKSGQVLSLVYKQRPDFNLFLYAADNKEAKQLAQEIVAKSTFLKKMSPMQLPDTGAV